MLFDYLAEVNERHKEKIHKGGHESIFVAKYLIKSSFLLLSKADKNLIKPNMLKR